jgi:lysozyme
MMLKEDIDEALDNCLKVFGDSVWYTLNDARRIVLANMMFNLGYTRFTGFKKMIAAVKEFDYMEAARQMEDSKWYRQVKRRGPELVQIMRDGVQLR